MRRPSIVGPATLLLAFCGEASAHGTSKGLGNFVGGAVHPLIEPSHLIAIAAVGLLIGQRGIRETKPALALMALALAIGLGLAAAGWTPDTDPTLLGLATLAGIAIALRAKMPRALYWIAAAVAGLGIGLGSKPDDVTGAAVATVMIGSGVGAEAWTFIVAVIVGELRRPWMLILVRVFGSWATACSVLVLALWVAQSHVLVPQGAPMPLDTRR